MSDRKPEPHAAEDLHLDDELAQRFVDGVLQGRVARSCELHLARCLECDALVESYRVLGGALSELEVPELPPTFTFAVLERVELHERARLAERRLAGGILAFSAVLALALLGGAGGSAWAPAFSSGLAGLASAAGALSVFFGVAAPLVRALRLELLVACAALGLPLLLALSRLVPRRAQAMA